MLQTPKKIYYSISSTETTNLSQKNPNEFQKVIIKDYKQGNTILFDIRCFTFVPNCHLTPQAIANLDDRRKEARHISDSSFLVHPESETINT